MGHLLSTQSSLVPLIDRLNRCPTGLVDSAKLHEILRLLLDEREAFVDPRVTGRVQASPFRHTFYAEASGPWDLTDRFGLRMSGQYTRQDGIGDELAGELSTYHAGVKSDLSYGGAVLTLAYTRTGNGNGIRKPWGGSPSYASLILEDFDRAGEKAWRLGLSYDFAEIAWKGMSGFVNYANGDTDDRGASASPDQEELDFTIDFKPTKGMLQGLWLRARAAFVDEKGPDAQDLADYRLILNYELPLL